MSLILPPYSLPCSLINSPLLPPDLDSSRISVITAERSTAFTISYIVRAATLAAVSASISTPVLPVTETVEVISTAEFAILSSTLTLVIGRGWQSGISSRFALRPYRRFWQRQRHLPSAPPFANQRQGCRFEDHTAGGDRHSGGIRFGGNVNHRRVTLIIQVRQLVHLSSAPNLPACLRW